MKSCLFTDYFFIFPKNYLFKYVIEHMVMGMALITNICQENNLTSEMVYGHKGNQILNCERVHIE